LPEAISDPTSDSPDQRRDEQLRKAEQLSTERPKIVDKNSTRC
jgi:hypothetical protein